MVIKDLPCELYLSNFGWVPHKHSLAIPKFSTFYSSAKKLVCHLLPAGFYEVSTVAYHVTAHLIIWTKFFIGMQIIQFSKKKKNNNPKTPGNTKLVNSVLWKQMAALKSSAVKAQVSFSAYNWAMCDRCCCSSLEQFNFWFSFVVSDRLTWFIFRIF